MLEYTSGGDRKRLEMLVLHDDVEREYTYGPAQHLAEAKVGSFTPALYAKALGRRRTDWKQIFPFE